MSVKTCRHIMENGTFCQSPALSKRQYCYFHLEFRARRMKMARARARGERWWLDLPCIEDMRSCQAATVRVFEASAAQLIDPADAKLLLSSLRLISSNFKAGKAWGQFSDYNNAGASDYVGSYPGFEAVHDLPKGLDLDDNPLKVFPMPEREEPTGAPFIPAVGMSGSLSSVSPAHGERRMASGENLGQILRDAQTAIPGLHGMDVTADDIELWEVAEREGEKAAQKRAATLERNRRRRERHLQRARYEEMARNRNIQLAAQKLLADQQRQAQAAAKAQQPGVEETPPVASFQPPAASYQPPAISPHAPVVSETANRSGGKKPSTSVPSSGVEHAPVAEEKPVSAGGVR